jgi:hypothetical protein
VVAVLLAINTASNFASRSTGEALLFGPLSLVLALSCLLVAASRQPDHPGEAPAAPAGATDDLTARSAAQQEDELWLPQS